MSREDRLRWDEKWTELCEEPFRPHSFLAGKRDLLSGGDALDLACGRGQNSIWLAQVGYRVLGVDISPVALKIARNRAISRGVDDQTRFQLADLDQWPIPEKAFDLICVFRFLDRRLFPAIRYGLRDGGLLFFCTRHSGVLKGKPGANNNYLLRSGELASTFSDWHILHDREDDEVAYFVARKPLNAN
jgi:SAM-dependent methyltransferase